MENSELRNDDEVLSVKMLYHHEPELPVLAENYGKFTWWDIGTTGKIMGKLYEHHGKMIVKSDRTSSQTGFTQFLGINAIHNSPTGQSQSKSSSSDT